jgi:uncharacterized protein
MLKKIFYLWLGVFLSQLAFAQNIPPRQQPARFVNDLATFLNNDEVQLLEAKLKAYNDSTSTQIAIVTIINLGGFSEVEYAQKLFETWGIGQKGKDNGLLLLVSKEDRKMRIHTGYGLEGKIPDVISSQIIQNQLVPNFKAGNFYQGFNAATDQIMAALRGDFKPEASDGSKQNQDKLWDYVWDFWLMHLIIILPILIGGGVYLFFFWYVIYEGIVNQKYKKQLGYKIGYYIWMLIPLWVGHYFMLKAYEILVLTTHTIFVFSLDLALNYLIFYLVYDPTSGGKTYSYNTNNKSTYKNSSKSWGGSSYADYAKSYSDYKDYSDYSDKSSYSDSYSDSSWGGGSSGGGGASGSW